MKALKGRLLIGGLAGVVGVGMSTGLAMAFGADASNGSSDGQQRQPYVLKQVAADSRLAWTDADATFAPLPSTVAVKTGFDEAEAALGVGFKNFLSDPNVSSQPTAALYSYSNDKYGQIQDDGSVELTYTNTPVWLVRLPLTSPLANISQGPQGTAPDASRFHGCSYYYIVDANSGEFITSGQHCDKVDD